MAWKPLSESVWSEVPRHPDPENDLGYVGRQLQRLEFDESGTVAVMPSNVESLAAEQFLVANQAAIVDLEELR